MRSQSGFAPILILAILAVLAVVGSVAWVHYYYLPHMSAQNAGPTQQSASNLPAEAPPSPPTQDFYSLPGNLPNNFAYYLTIAGTKNITIQDASGTALNFAYANDPTINAAQRANMITAGFLLEKEGLTFYAENTSGTAWQFIIPLSQKYDIYLGPSDKSLSISLTTENGVSSSSPLTMRYRDLLLPNGSLGRFEVGPQGVGILYEGNSSSSLTMPIAPTYIGSSTAVATVPITAANNVAPLSASTTPNGDNVTVAINAGDPSNVQDIYYALGQSIDMPQNIAAQKYTGPFSANPVATPVVYAFANYKTGDRSPLATMVITDALIASFTAQPPDKGWVAPLGVRFSNTSISKYVPETCSWDLGVPTSASNYYNCSANASYSSPGTYHITLFVTDAAGRTASTSQDIVITSPQPSTQSGGTTVTSGAQITAAQSSSTATAAARDLTRLSDLRLVFNELGLYYNQCGYYPGTAISYFKCAPSHIPISSWGDANSGLTQALLSSGIGITNVPQDPSPGATYYYGTDAAGAHYVIAAKLEEKGDAIFSSYTPPSLTGFTIDGLSSCSPPLYCMSL